MATVHNPFAQALGTVAADTSAGWYQQAQLTNNALYTYSDNTTTWDHQPYGATLAVSPPSTARPDKTLKAIKGAIHDIRAEVVTEEARHVIDAKAKKYLEAGFKKQSSILEDETKARIRLARIKEWDYKVLPYEALKKYHNSIIGGWQMIVHINPIENYTGVPEGADISEAKNKIVPENIVDKLIEAKDRQVFDTYHVLWVEKVKDPLLLGKVNELQDYFLIAEWGDDVRFDDIIKASKQSEQKKK